MNRIRRSIVIGIKDHVYMNSRGLVGKKINVPWVMTTGKIVILIPQLK